MSTLVLPGVSHAYANHGRWVVDCSHRESCDSAVQMPRFAGGFVCGNCGGHTEVVWPADDMVYSVERILLMRPNPKNQNWSPGETLHDLMFENAAHGIFDGLEDLELSGSSLFAVDDGGIQVDLLPVLNPRRELAR